MHYEITPEPTPEERDALVAAIERLGDEQPFRESAWWRAGIRESTEEDA